MSFHYPSYSSSPTIIVLASISFILPVLSFNTEIWTEYLFTMFDGVIHYVIYYIEFNYIVFIVFMIFITAKRTPLFLVLFISILNCGRNLQYYAATKILKLSEMGFCFQFLQIIGFQKNKSKKLVSSHKTLPSWVDTVDSFQNSIFFLIYLVDVLSSQHNIWIYNQLYN